MIGGKKNNLIASPVADESQPSSQTLATPSPASKKNEETRTSPVSKEEPEMPEEETPRERKSRIREELDKGLEVKGKHRNNKRKRAF